MVVTSRELIERSGKDSMRSGVFEEAAPQCFGPHSQRDNDRYPKIFIAEIVMNENCDAETGDW
jgi:hypothetical protein